MKFLLKLVAPVSTHQPSPATSGGLVLFNCIVDLTRLLVLMVHSLDLEERMLPVQVRDFYGDSFLTVLR